jgi:hypothetical protein
MDESVVELGTEHVTSRIRRIHFQFYELGIWKIVLWVQKNWKRMTLIGLSVQGMGTI